VQPLSSTLTMSTAAVFLRRRANLMITDQFFITYQ